MFTTWLKKYYQNNKAVPTEILIYREGLSDKQAESQLSSTYVPAINKSVETLVQRTKAKKSPGVTLLLAETKINDRMFVRGGGRKGEAYTNPMSGTVIADEMSVNDAFDFRLVAQLVTQGTCTPVHYKVGYQNNSGLSQEALIQYTYNQCFNYFNWEGAVKVPGCLQYANKLAKLVGENFRSEPIEALEEKLYYL